MRNLYLKHKSLILKTKKEQMKKVFNTLFLVLLVSATSFAQVDKEYTKTLKKMFAVSGANESYNAAIKQMFTMFKQQYTNVEADIWEELEKEFSQTSINDLTEKLVPIYAKYMTKDDLVAMINFYETPIGKKYAKNTPLIMQESMQVGQEWGMQIGQDFTEKMKKKGY